MEDSFFSLVRNAAHWEFELFLMFIFDVVIGLILWPCLRRWTRHHKSDDQRLADLEATVRGLQLRLGIIPPNVRRDKKSACKCHGEKEKA